MRCAVTARAAVVVEVVKAAAPPVEVSALVLVVAQRSASSNNPLHSINLMVVSSIGGYVLFYNYLIFLP